MQQTETVRLLALDGAQGSYLVEVESMQTGMTEAIYGGPDAMQRARAFCWKVGFRVVRQEDRNEAGEVVAWSER